MINYDRIVVYDIETLKNCFTAIFIDYKTKKKKTFVIYDDEDYVKEPKRLYDFLVSLQKNKYVLLGYNSIGFDGQVIDWFMDQYKNRTMRSLADLIDGIYDKAQDVIEGQNDWGSGKTKFEGSLYHKPIDIYKQKHYDGFAKRTSLKWLQFTMRLANIQDMPIEHTQEIEKHQIQEILDYNTHDVESTLKFFELNKYETEIRDALGKEYGVTLINNSEPRMAKTIFGRILSKEMNIPYKELKEMRTHRELIPLKDLVLPKVRFTSPECQEALDIVNNEIVDARPEMKHSFKHEFEYAGMNVDIGLGGIHACNKPGVYEPEEDEVIIDVDVKSYYPNLAIKNGFKPAQLGDVFLNVYSNLYEQRTKIPKSNPKNYILKIILNSTYGLSKEINSYLYDPLFTYSITINGQLLLLMLTETIHKSIPCEMIQINTDGLTVKLKKKDEEKLRNICERFEKYTDLELEYADYSKMVVRDVNNYIAISTDGKVKKKGVFETELSLEEGLKGVQWHKNPSNMIVRKAATEYFVNGNDYEKFIDENNNVYDYCAAVKKTRSFNLNLYFNKGGVLCPEPQQKITRYYASKDGGLLLKDFHDGRVTSVLAGQKVTVVNKIEEDKEYDNIDKDYYKQKTKDLIESVTGLTNE